MKTLLPTIDYYQKKGNAGIELIDLAQLSSSNVFRSSSPTTIKRLRFHLWVLPEYSGTHTVDFRTIEFQAGDIFYIGYGQTHAWHLRENMRGKLLLMTQTYASRITPLLPDGLFFAMQAACVWPLANPHLTKTLYECLLTEIKEGVSIETIELLVAHFLRYHRPIGNHDVKPSDQSRFARFLADFENYYTQHRDAQFYASRLGLTSGAFNLFMKRMTGMNAKMYIDRGIVMEAQRRLSVEKISIATLAQELGFVQATHFVKFFQRIVGTTPGVFRRGTRKNQS